MYTEAEVIPIAELFENDYFLWGVLGDGRSREHKIHGEIVITSSSNAAFLLLLDRSFMIFVYFSKPSSTNTNWRNHLPSP